MFRPNAILLVATVFCLVFAVRPVCGQTGLTEAEIDSIYAEFPDFAREAAKKVGLVWHGQERYVSFEQFASYCAPILWFSPDEPPLLIVKNVGDPIGGGWFFNRVYLKDYRLRDVAWNLMYAPSASRWIDSYFGAGVEWDSDGTETRTEFMVETGVKLRFSIAHSPLKFMSAITDFWGLRVGVKNFGLSDWT